MNAICIVGRLTKDPQLRRTETTSRTRFTVAINRVWKNKAGETKEDVDFVPVVVFGRQAEVCCEYLKKGSRIATHGRLSCGSYKTDEGTYVNYAEVIASHVEFLDTRSDNGKGRETNEQQTSEPEEKTEEEVPF